MKPYRLRWEPKFFIRAVIFGIVFLAFLLILNYLNSDKVKEYDMVFWNSFFTLAMTYCAYVAQIIYSDFKELNPDKAGNVKYIAHRITKYFTPIALCVIFSYFVIQIATGTPHYKEIIFGAMVLCVSAVVNVLTKEK
jgi:L-asparagine transporter-like permease